MLRSTRAAWGILSICAVAALGSCQCEQEIRDAVTRNNVQKHFDDSSATSGPQEEEPNDVPEQATLVELGESLRDVDGRVESRSDRDWYSLQPTDDEHQLLTVRVVPRSEGLDSIVQVELEPSGSDTVTYDNRGEGELETVRNLALSSDVRRVGVRGRGGSTGRYTLEFERRLTAGAVEHEPNDEPEVATRYEFPGDIQSFYDRPDDVDWFHVLRQDASPGIYRLNVSPTGSFGQKVRVFLQREAQEPYVSFQVPTDRPLDVPNVRIPEELDGIWLRFSAGQEYDRENGYRLRTVEHPTKSGRTVEAEPNDTEEQSMGIEVAEAVGGYLHSDGDLDRFHLAVGRPLPETTDGGDVGTGEPSGDTSRAEETNSADTGPEERPGDGPGARRDEPVSPIERVEEKDRPKHVIQVGLEPLDEAQELTLLWWRDGPESRPRTFESSGAGKPVKLCNHSTDRDLMQLGVRAEKLDERSIRRGFTYELSTVDIAERVEGLEMEPNERRERADRLEFGRPRTGYISSADDRDVFAFGVKRPESDRASTGASGENAEATGTDSEASGREETGSDESLEPQSVRIELRGNELNLGFDVLDSEGALVDEVDRGGPGVDESTSIDLPPGLYFVRVRSDGGAVCKPYRLGVERGDERSGRKNTDQ